MQHPLLSKTLQFAKEQPGLEALVTVNGSEYRKYSYHQLVEKTASDASCLKGVGIQPQQKVLLLVTPGLDFLSLTLAIISCGAVPMFLDPGMGLPNIRKCISDCEPQGFIGSGKAQVLRLLARKEFKSVGWCITTAGIPLPKTTRLHSSSRATREPKDRGADRFEKLSQTDYQLDEPALIAFTSGATGTPKGVVFTVETLAAQLRIFEEIFGSTLGNRDLPLLPIFSIYNVALGVSSVFGVTHPTRPLQFDPDLVIKVIKDLEVTSSFGSPTLWEKISDAAKARGFVHVRMNRLCMAGVGVPGRVLQKTRELFPKAIILTPYGSTEALPVTSMESAERLDTSQLNSSRAFGFGTLVGKPLIEVRIVEIGQSINPNDSLGYREIGEVIVSGANVSTSYLNRPEATAQAKVLDAQGVLWHRMGDVGYLDELGKLYYCGRKTHAVHARNGQFYSECVENVFNTIPELRRSALVYFSSTDEAGVAIEIDASKDTKEFRHGLLEKLLDLAKQHAWTAGLKRFEFHTSFPVDARHNAKIFRERLGD